MALRLLGWNITRDGETVPRRASDPEESRLAAIELHIKTLYDLGRENVRELQQLRQEEVRRAAEHAAMVDQLTRLYKRVSARITREPNGTEPADPLSTGELRRRLGR